MIADQPCGSDWDIDMHSFDNLFLSKRVIVLSTNEISRMQVYTVEPRYTPRYTYTEGILAPLFSK